MGYYAGDFYAGARGDPGFLGNLLTLGKSALGFLPGGGAASRAIDVVSKAATAGRAVVATGKSQLMKHPAITAAGAAGAVAVAGGVVGEHLAMSGGMPPKGYHRCKSKRGCKHGAFVRNRRMNACNPRALRRAIRRTHAFARVAMKTIHIVHPKKKGHFGGFKKKRKS